MVAWIPARLPMVQFRGQTVVKRRERKMVSHSKRCVIGLLIFAGVIAGALTDPSQLGSQSAVAASVLLKDDFNDGAADGWTISPLGQAAGWRVVDRVYTYDGGGHTQSYRGTASWTDYTLEAKIRLATLNNYPGGIRGRVNPGTGAGYAVWVYPATGEIRLVRATAWSIDSPELTVLGVATGVPFDVGAFHTLRTTFTGTAISVYYDGILALRATDTVYRSGVIALDVSNQPIEFDDVVVTYGALAQRFNSAERGCDGSDPNILLCDEFGDGEAMLPAAGKE